MKLKNKIHIISHSIDKKSLFEENENLFKSERSKKKQKIKTKDIYKFKIWPKYISIQRQRKIFSTKMKIPPPIFRFTKVLGKNLTDNLFSYLLKITFDVNKRKETIPNDMNVDKIVVAHGINKITNMIKKKKLIFVIIANDVSPIECIVWLPSLCDYMKIPYVIVKDKSRLGKIVGMKSTSCLGVYSLNESKTENLKKMFEKFEYKS